LEDHPSRLNKEAIILVEAAAGNDELFQGFRLAFDAMITFGLKQIPEKTDADGAGLSWDNLVSLLLVLLIAHSPATLLVTLLQT